jgi:hypothetical protein
MLMSSKANACCARLLRPTSNMSPTLFCVGSRPVAPSEAGCTFRRLWFDTHASMLLDRSFRRLWFETYKRRAQR